MVLFSSINTLECASSQKEIFYFLQGFENVCFEDKTIVKLEYLSKINITKAAKKKWTNKNWFHLTCRKLIIQSLLLIMTWIQSTNKNIIVYSDSFEEFVINNRNSFELQFTSPNKVYIYCFFSFALFSFCVSFFVILLWIRICISI